MTRACWTRRSWPSSRTRRPRSSSCRWPPQGSGIYGVLFDTSNLTRCPEPPSSDLCVVFPNISFRAVDLVGNQSVLSLRILRRQHRARGRPGSADDAAEDAERRRAINARSRSIRCRVNQEIGRHAERRLHGSPGLRSARPHRGRRQPRQRAEGHAHLAGRPGQHERLHHAGLREPAAGRRQRRRRPLRPGEPAADARSARRRRPRRAAASCRFAWRPSRPAERATSSRTRRCRRTAPCGRGTATGPPQRLCNSFEQPTHRDRLFGQPAGHLVGRAHRRDVSLFRKSARRLREQDSGRLGLHRRSDPRQGRQPERLGPDAGLHQLRRDRRLLPGAARQRAARPRPAPARTIPTAKTAAVGACIARSFPKQLEYYCVPGDC